MRKSRFGNVPPGQDNPLNDALTRRDADIIEQVAHAVAHKQCLLAYQSIIVSRDLSRIGFYEGLIRILDETGRIIPAREFMPVVERTELGREIDRIAIRMGLQALHEYPDLRLAINMSARSIGYQPWMKTLNHWLRKDSTIGERLILEITESSAIDQPEITLDFTARLTEQGICFALDDFGSGYTALRYLKDFYFDILKIDGAFCNNIADEPDNQALVRSMVDIAGHFDMLTVAECVEREDDARVLVEIGVDCLQGFLFDAPTTQPNWAFGVSTPQRQNTSVA